jgi:hypothetical protein
MVDCAAVMDWTARQLMMDLELGSSAARPSRVRATPVSRQSSLQPHEALTRSNQDITRIRSSRAPSITFDH